MIIIRNKKKKLYIILTVSLIFSIIVGTSIGAVNVPIDETIKIIINNLFNKNIFILDKSFESIIFNVRLPRVIVTAIVGASLAIAGTVVQSIFRNPMADPGVIGISSGASLGAIVAIFLGLSGMSIYFVPVFAILGALLIALLIYRLANRKNEHASMLSLILSGIAISTFIRGIISFILTSLNEEQMKSYMFWSIGSLADRRWEHVKLILIPSIICIFMLKKYSHDLNILLLGDEEAHSLGLNPNKTRKKILLWASITTALAVSVSGGISFIGLIIPHIMRLIVGPDNKLLLSSSALLGAIFLIGCDLIARILLSPIELSVGIITSIIGAPYFLYLLNKNRKDGVIL